MISICFKSNNREKLNFIENQITSCKIPNIYYYQKKFSKYNNLIIHYLGKKESDFYNALSNIFFNYLKKYVENSQIDSILKYEYFYFNQTEKNIIQKKCTNELNTNESKSIVHNILYKNLKEYFSTHKKAHLNGFIYFRLYEYKSLLEKILNNCINNYIIEKEYYDYIELLKKYINTQLSQSEELHLLYSKDLKILLDAEKNIISNSENHQIYLSDITFSSNDFILNALLSYLPKKIIIHQSTSDDNFLKFLKIIFENRYEICNKCETCKKRIIH